MKRGAKIYYGELYCPVCGTRMVIPRRGLRKQGHIKTMFCGRCGDMRDFVEETRVMRGEEDNAIMGNAEANDPSAN